MFDKKIMFGAVLKANGTNVKPGLTAVPFMKKE